MTWLPLRLICPVCKMGHQEHFLKEWWKIEGAGGWKFLVNYDGLSIHEGGTWDQVGNETGEKGRERWLGGSVGWSIVPYTGLFPSWVMYGRQWMDVSLSH